jgi:ATP-dependent Clp protease protease subunit
MSNELWIYDFIGESLFESGVTAKSVRDELEKMDKKKPVSVRFNTPGGDVFEAIAIRALLAEWKAGVEGQVDGLAASMGSYIATICQPLTMAEGSMIMVHQPWTITMGNANDLEKDIETLRKIEGNFANVYADRSGQKPAAVKEKLDEETWFTVEEAIEFGLADGKAEVAAAAFKIPKQFGFKRPPQAPEEPHQRASGHLAVLERQIQLQREIALGKSA